MDPMIVERPSKIEMYYDGDWQVEWNYRAPGGIKRASQNYVTKWGAKRMVRRLQRMTWENDE